MKKQGSPDSSPLMKRSPLLAICCALILLTSAASAATEKRIRFTVPEAPWTMTLLADKFEVTQKQIDPNRRHGSVFLADHDRHINISIVVRPANECGNSRSCRDILWRESINSRANVEDIVLFEIGEVSCIEFVNPRFQGHPIPMQHMRAEFVVDGFLVDLHMMRGRNRSGNREKFERIIKSIKFEPKDN